MTCKVTEGICSVFCRFEMTIGGSRIRRPRESTRRRKTTHEKSDISLSGSSDHVRDVSLVTGSVQDGVSPGIGLEVGSSNLNGLSLE